MPTYDFYCDTCGKIENIFTHINDTFIECPICGNAPAKRLFSPPRMIIPDIQPYYDEHLAGPDGNPVYVQSRQHKRQILKELGLEQRR